MGHGFVFALMTASAISLGPALAQTPPSGVDSPSTTPAQQGASDAASKKGSNIRASPRKHRYWRHRGGRHPHFGSRRLQNPR
jgi:hypothetical protein